MRKKIEEALKLKLKEKLSNYKPETSYMPFHTRLLGRDRMALSSFIHSLNTTFGTSIFEPVAQILGASVFEEAGSQQVAGNLISSEAHNVIQEIMDKLTRADSAPDKKAEVELIRDVCRSGEMREVKLSKVDLKLVSKTGDIYLIDITNTKPKTDAFKEFKRTLLEWAAAALAENPDAKINTLIAIPYNPYEPNPYRRWIIRGMLDLEQELKVAKEFWNFVGGEGAYEMLLDTFEKVGIEMRPEIDAKFAEFQ